MEWVQLHFIKKYLVHCKNMEYNGSSANAGFACGVNISERSP